MVLKEKNMSFSCTSLFPVGQNLDRMSKVQLAISGHAPVMVEQKKSHLVQAIAISRFLKALDSSSCFHSCLSQISSTPVTKLIFSKKSDKIKILPKALQFFPTALIINPNNLATGSLWFGIWHLSLHSPDPATVASFLFPDTAKPFLPSKLHAYCSVCFAQVLPGFSHASALVQMSPIQRDFPWFPSYRGLPTLISTSSPYLFPSLHLITACVNLCIPFPLLKCRFYRGLLCVVYNCNMSF